MSTDTDSDEPPAGDSGPGTREVAYRLFATEFDAATVSYSESDEERAPNYVVTPTGLRVNRLFAVGVLTEVERLNTDTLRGRIVDPTGAFVTYAGQYQPEAQAFLDGAEAPSFVSITGKARTFEPDDADQTFTSVRPESLSEVTADTRDRWTVSAAEATLDRIAVFVAALDSGLTGDKLRAALANAGVDTSLAAGIPKAIDQYETTTAYLEAIRQCAVEALELVAGERDEIEPVTLAPDEGGTATLGPLPTVDVTLSAAAADAADAPDEVSTTGTTAAETPETAPTAKPGDVAGATTTDTTETATAAADEPSPTATETTSTASTDPASTTSGETETAATDTPKPNATDSDQDMTADSATESRTPPAEPSTAETPSEPSTAETPTTADGDTDSTTTPESERSHPSAVTDPVAETDTTTETDAATAADEAEDAEPEMYQLDADEREELESEYGADFASGNEVDPAGEADIDVPDADDLAAAAETADEPVDTESEPPESTAPDSATGTLGSFEDPLDSDDGSVDPPTDATTPSDDGTTSGSVAADDADDIDLESVAVEIMGELDDGDGADREAVVATVVEQHGVDGVAVEDAIDDALMGGRCYEPDDGTLKPI